MIAYNPPKTANELDQFLYENNEVTIKVVQEAARQILLRNMLLMRNFDYKEIEWENLDLHGETESLGHYSLKCMQEIFLYQQITEHTGATGGDTPSTPEFSFTYNNQEIDNIKYDAPHRRSDHVVLDISYVVSKEITMKAEKKPNLKISYIELYRTKQVLLGFRVE